MEDLPEDIQSKILSCVPLESVLECKLVSKTWNTLLSQRNIATGLLLSVHKYYWLDGRRSRRTCGQSSRKTDVTLHFGYYNDILNLTRQANDRRDQCLYKRLPKIKHPQPNKNIFRGSSLIGSCNGLVCLVMNDETVSNIYVFNPFTGECFKLPTIDKKEGYISMVIGFGYNSSGRNYKVVTSQYHFRNQEGSVQVFTLGGGDNSGWRNIGELDYFFIYEGILWNGSLHWLDRNQCKILAFDLAEEEFRYLPTPPPSLGHTQVTKLTLLGGYLRIVSMDRFKEFTYIWTFKNKQKDDFAGEASWDWILEFSIPFLPTDGPFVPTDGYDRYQPFGITKKNEVFLWYKKPDRSGYHYTDSILCRYDPKTNDLIKVLDVGVTPFAGIPHVNSFVSLKALGVDSKTIGFAADCEEEYGSKNII